MLLYHIDGIRINDSWYWHEKNVYHTFFLAYGEHEPIEGQWDRQRIGHMTSTDLKSFEYLLIFPVSFLYFNDKLLILRFESDFRFFTQIIIIPCAPFHNIFVIDRLFFRYIQHHIDVVEVR